MTKRRRNNRGRPRGGQAAMQKIAFIAAKTAANATTTTVTATDLGLTGNLLTRPTRPRSVTIEYMSTVARSFTFFVVAGDGEEVYHSPPLLSGPIPRKFTCTIPSSTDFALYPSQSAVVSFSHAQNPAINWVINVHFAVKYPVAAVNF